MEEVKLFALITESQGTAMSETALCSEHYADEDARFKAREAAQEPWSIKEFVECTGNDALECIICGKGRI